ncbi:MAG TPA: UDP-N-acetyl-D-mannosamine dehydrogenase [Propionibacteriaceae bacterium]|nr:UDP-N-acetyl-D-mannosamine dehydrogenase [Propionibacteriaceae bacterium]
MDNPTVAVVGLGYIGLPTAAILAKQGIRVIGVEVSQERVDVINSGRAPFVEPALEEVLVATVKAGKLSATTEMPHADVYILAVPTPFKGDHEADLSYVKDASEAVAPQLVGDELVILESTSPPGTTEKVAEYILAKRPDLSFDGADGKPIIHFAHAPERVLPGRIMVELISNDRIIGGMTREASERARDLYATFCTADLHLTDAKTAEMAKLTENSFRDVNIAFANELSIICERLGIDVWELIELANKHPRVNILQPGPGVGGHCIAVDPWFIVSAAPEEAQLIHTARLVNDGKPDHVLAKVADALSGSDAPVIAALGLAFKPDIDDLRESPALSITRTLAERMPHATILAVEPHVDELPPRLAEMGNVSLAETRDALDRADLVLLLVDHTDFKQIDRASLGDKPVIDTRGMWR